MMNPRDEDERLRCSTVKYWKIVNIDKAAELKNNSGVKLWEILVNGAPQQLLPLLTTDRSLASFCIPVHPIAASKAKWYARLLRTRCSD